MGASTRVSSAIAISQLGLIEAKFNEFAELLASARPTSFDQLGELKMQYSRLQSEALSRVKQYLDDDSLTEQLAARMRPAIPPEPTRRQELAALRGAALRAEEWLGDQRIRLD